VNLLPPYPNWPYKYGLRLLVTSLVLIIVLLPFDALGSWITVPIVLSIPLLIIGLLLAFGRVVIRALKTGE
jgi:hypothetical protein